MPGFGRPPGPLVPGRGPAGRGGMPGVAPGRGAGGRPGIAGVLPPTPKGLLPGRGPGRAAGAAAESGSAGTCGLGLGPGVGGAETAVGVPTAAGACTSGRSTAAGRWSTPGRSTATGGWSPAGRGCWPFAGVGPAGLTPVGWAAAFAGAGAASPGGGNASLSRRATGASTVEDALLTNSPSSLSLARTVLLSTPSSFASSCTRALPAIGLLVSRPAATRSTPSLLGQRTHR